MCRVGEKADRFHCRPLSPNAAEVFPVDHFIGGISFPHLSPAAAPRDLALHCSWNILGRPLPWTQSFFRYSSHFSISYTEPASRAFSYVKIFVVEISGLMMAGPNPRLSHDRLDGGSGGDSERRRTVQQPDPANFWGEDSTRS